MTSSAMNASRRGDGARSGPGLFLRRWLANPLQMGSIVPSSPALCARIVRHACPAEGETVLELGAGTGVIGRALLAAGLAPERLVVVEIVPEMAAHLRTVLPGVTVIEGDARDLLDRSQAQNHGQIGSVICGIPLVLQPRAEQRRFVELMTALGPECGFLHYSYCITSPLPAASLGLAGRRVAWTPRNFPPASLWHYTKLP